jgi:hypothetical protein
VSSAVGQGVLHGGSLGVLEEYALLQGVLSLQIVYRYLAARLRGSCPRAVRLLPAAVFSAYCRAGKGLLQLPVFCR